MTYISKDDPPFLVVDGTADPLVPPQQGEFFVQALKQGGVNATMEYVFGAGHSINQVLTPDMMEEVTTWRGRTATNSESRGSGRRHFHRWNQGPDGSLRSHTPTSCEWSTLMKYATQFIVQHGWKLLIADMGLNPAEVLRRAELPGDLFDSFAGSTTGKSILEEQPNSISSGRTMEEIVRDWTRPKNKYTRQTKLFDEK